MVSSLGLAALFYTLRETRRAANATVSATAAYLFPSISGAVNEEEPGLTRFTISIENVGQTPARNVRVELVQPAWGDDDELEQPWSMEPDVTTLLAHGAIGPGSNIHRHIQLQAYFLKERALYKYPCYVTVRGTYETAFKPVEERDFFLTFVYDSHGGEVDSANPEFGWHLREGEYQLGRARTSRVR